MKKNARVILSALAVYIILLMLLTQAESGDPNATILSFWDAVWFSLITMTTVGYGDLSPVTAPGRILGLIFALCSIGILTALIGIGLRLIGGAFIPRLRLRLGRRRRWYAFTHESEDAAALSEALLREDGGCLLIFPEEDRGLVGGPNVIHMNFDTAMLTKLRGGTEGFSLFCMGPEPWENYTRALTAAEAGIASYCMADLSAERFPPELQMFSPREAMSRQYWKEHPLKKSERTVVLIGCGENGSALLERALLTNVFEPGRSVEYHVFGDVSDFAGLHPEIVKAMTTGVPGEDSLCFHDGDWAEARELIGRADRIILACDADRDNLETYEKLRSWFSSAAAVHVRLIEPVPGIDSFGGRAESIRPEFVMKDEVNRRAILMNDIYNEGSPDPTAWRDLTPFLRQSNIAAADHLIVKARYLLDDEDLTELTDGDCRRAYERYMQLYPTQADLLQETEHRRWMRFYQMYNWQYDPVRNNALRRHPMLLPYEKLTLADQKKDAYAWEMLGRLGGRKE
ncbi:MAG: ion transporter [Oscillospiraceae bacterium]|nr:ion transporter [Oscillospiraceae bacterium]